ncbi:MAG TPA: adenosylcobinamide amidohydrolase [Polyangiales bacterium]|nr:adenosylcobinamide amidohydrolase [Polyangiales bacterium]
MIAEGPHVCLSHAPYRGALRAARSVIIHETRNDELSLDVDPLAPLATRMAASDPRGVSMLTSRRVAAAVVNVAQFDDVRAVALVTAGLSNALRVGDTPGPLAGWGTINIACQIDVPLSTSALIEALAIAVEARTSAVIDARVRSRRGAGHATGTGTDCTAILAPRHTKQRAHYAGKHTVVGHVIGEAVVRATETAIANWQAEQPG